MSRINFSPLWDAIDLTPEEVSREALVQAIAEDGEKCDCLHPMLSKGSSICDFCGKFNDKADSAREPGHQHGCICADCSGAELTSEND